MKLALLNTTIATTDGEFEICSISLKEAQKIIATADGLDSAIGHESTAEVMSTLLGVNIPVVRQQFEQKKNQKALVFKLKGRPPEGKVLSKADIEDIGYNFKVMTRKS